MNAAVEKIQRAESLLFSLLKYLPEVKRAQQAKQRLSVAMTRKGTKRLFSTFDLTPFQPQKSKNGKGRKKGMQLTKRPKCPPTKKTKVHEKNKQKVELLEYTY